MNTSLSLEQLAQEFTHWRTNRKSKIEKTPLSLIEHAVSLTQVHSRSQIQKRLGISGSQMSKWLQQTPQPNMSFVALPLVEAESTLKLTIDNQQGSRLELTGLHTHDLGVVIQHFTSVGQSL